MISKLKSESEFTWRGVDRTGRKVSGVIKAIDRKTVWLQLIRRGIKNPKIRKKRHFVGRQPNSQDITLFLRQLASMVQAGATIVQSFEVISEGIQKPRMAELVNYLKEHVIAGNSLSSGFASKPEYFDELSCGLTIIGENSGSLEGMLNRLATYKEKSEALKRKVKSALIYPISIICITGIVVGILLVKVVPAFEKIFASFNSELPAFTRWVINLSAIVQEFWMLGLFSLTLLMLVFRFCYKRYVWLQWFMHRLVLKIPVFGSLIEKNIIASFSSSLSTSVTAGVPLVSALQSVANTISNMVYHNAILNARTDVISGTRLYLAIRSTNVFPATVVQLISIGEESGHLDIMLTRISEYYQQQVDTMIDGLSKLIEPFIMSVIGILIGGLIISIYLPIFNLGGALGGGVS